MDVTVNVTQKHIDLGNACDSSAPAIYHALRNVFSEKVSKVFSGDFIQLNVYPN